LIKTTYVDPNGQIRDWESCQRPTRPKNSEIDGVGIAAILEKEDGPHILLQKQFRPPIAKVVIEVPAGLIDEGENAEVCALRELKEETGYVGEIVRGGFEMTPVMFNGRNFEFAPRKEALTFNIRSGILQYQLEYGTCHRGHVETGESES
jgi:ADP-ribose pyrophosphatase